MADVEVKPRFSNWPSIPEFQELRFLHSPSASLMRLHLHPRQLEITCVVRGHFAWWAGEDRLTVTGGDIFIHRPDEVHGGADGTFEAMSLFGVILEVPPEGKPFLGLPDEESAELGRDLLALPRQFRARPSVMPLFKQAVAAYYAPRTTLNALTLRVRLVSLLVEIIASAATFQAATPTPPVARALAIMREHLAEPLGLEAIAEAVDWSLSHFKARFRQEMGITPAKEYLRLRVMEALDRLAAGQSVTHVAHALGFCSSQHFATCVRRVTGRRPSDFQA